MRSAWARAMQQAMIETLAIVAGVIVVLAILAIAAGVAVYVLSGCLEATCI